MKKIVMILTFILTNVIYSLAFNPISVGGSSYSYGSSSEYPRFSCEHCNRQIMNCIKHGRVDVFKCTLCGPDGKSITRSGCRVCLNEQHNKNIEYLRKQKKAKEAKLKEAQLKREKASMLKRYDKIDGKLIIITSFIGKTKDGGLYIGYWKGFDNEVAIILQDINIVDETEYCVWFFGERVEMPLTTHYGRRYKTIKPNYGIPASQLPMKNTGTNNPKFAGFYRDTYYDFVVSSTNDFHIIEALPHR